MEEGKIGRGKYALITGASSGFGYEFARLAAADGFGLVLVARDEPKLRSMADEITREFMVDVIPIAKDLFKLSAAEEIYREVNARRLMVEVLINDAGQGEHGNFLEYHLDRDIDMIQLNITSLVCLTKLFLRDMVMRNAGRILQVSSILAKYPTPLMTVYAATKAFVLNFTEGLLQELKDTQVVLTALLPGPSDTDFFHKAGAEDSTVYREDSLSDPAQVARDGYEALMRGDSRVVSGLKNKAYDVISNILPDAALGKTMKQKMEPSEKLEGRDEIGHGPSREERERITRATGAPDGDYRSHEDHIHSTE